MSELRWEPYLRPRKDHIRVTETSCCGVYEWASQGGQFLILRAVKSGGYEEAGRGRYKDARELWLMLIAVFKEEHVCRNPYAADAGALPRGNTSLRKSGRLERVQNAVGAAPTDA